MKLSGEIQISQKIPFGSMNISCSQATQDPTLYRHVFDYDNGTADVTKCSSKFFCNTRRPNVKTWRLAELNYPLRNSFF